MKKQADTSDAVFQRLSTSQQTTPATGPKTNAINSVIPETGNKRRVRIQSDDPEPGPLTSLPHLEQPEGRWWSFICRSPRKTCIFCASVKLILNVAFISSFIVLLMMEHHREGYMYVGCALSFVCSSSAVLLLIGAIKRIPWMFWIPMGMILLHFLPFSIFVYVIADYMGLTVWMSVLLTCVLGIIVLSLSLYELMIVVSYYERLTQKM